MLVPWRVSKALYNVTRRIPARCFLRAIPWANPWFMNSINVGFSSSFDDMIATFLRNSLFLHGTAWTGRKVSWNSMFFFLRFFLLGGGDLEDDWSESLKKSFTNLVNYDRGDLKSLGAKKNISFCRRF